MIKKKTKKLPSPLRGAIVAMTRDRVIGIGGKLPWHYREDLTNFKDRTMGCAIIMGRITWDSIGRKELPGRRNIVISRSEVSGVENYRSVDDAVVACGDNDLWIIGGAQIYKAAMEYLNVLDITWIPDAIEDKYAALFTEINVSYNSPTSQQSGLLSFGNWRSTENKQFPKISPEWHLHKKSVLSKKDNLLNSIYLRAD